MTYWRGISKVVTPVVSLAESTVAVPSRSRPRPLLRVGIQQRTYYASKSLSRISAHDHRRIGSHRIATLQQQSGAPQSVAAVQLSQNLVTKRWHGGPHVDHEHADSIHVSFLDAEGNALKANVDAYVGESLLQVAQRNDIELEGACEGVCACSTCHVIFPDEDLFDSLEEASEDEEDMLDMAYGLQETSRLGCQIIINNEMDGMEIEIPPATRNFYVDGHVPKPH